MATVKTYDGLSTYMYSANNASLYENGNKTSPVNNNRFISIDKAPYITEDLPVKQLLLNINLCPVKTLKPAAMTMLRHTSNPETIEVYLVNTLLIAKMKQNGFGALLTNYSNEVWAAINCNRYFHKETGAIFQPPKFDIPEESYFKDNVNTLNDYLPLTVLLHSATGSSMVNLEWRNGLSLLPGQRIMVLGMYPVMYKVRTMADM